MAVTVDSGGTGHWRELCPGVLVRRYAELDLTVGLVLGDERALVIDTRGDRRQGAELAEAVRGLTRLPTQVVLTHAHFDHCFGTTAFTPVPVWSHVDFTAHLTATAELQREAWTRHYRAVGEAETAAALAETALEFPDRSVDEPVLLDLGGRTVRLFHPGPGHTDHDLVVRVEDAAVSFVGDLLENGACPDFEDAHPLRWPDSLEQVLGHSDELFVPGHGDPMSPEQAARQHTELRSLAELCAGVSRGELGEREAVARGPYPEETVRAALSRVGGG
ncbi:MBL fold metallo-hydrolase [Actinopolyspora mortivallis]|uniref:MBL fold metallo-hydrolase n=1 Tax=Actinopolyspora mortivallis TaxID=33906 RepID=UPI00035E9EAD|nr:MBL fold metallo-hydrolase [Actinopolyspora mortivallis]